MTTDLRVRSSSSMQWLGVSFVSSSAPPRAVRTATAHLWKEFSHFFAGSISKKILLEATTIAKEKIRRSLVNDVSREQIERRVNVANPFGIYQPVLPFSGRALGLMKKPPEILTGCFAISRLVSAADHDVHRGPTPLAKPIAPACGKFVQLFKFNAHGQLCSLERVRGHGADVFLESVEIDYAFGENSVDQLTSAAQQLGGRFHCWRGAQRAVGFANLCAFFVKLVHSDVVETAASVCHERELDAKREVAKRLELMIPRGYDLFTLFAAVAEKRCIVADQNNHRNAVAELRQDLFDEPRIGFVKTDVNCRERFIARRNVPRVGEFALRIRVRAIH